VTVAAPEQQITEPRPLRIEIPVVRTNGRGAVPAKVRTAAVPAPPLAIELPRFLTTAPRPARRGRMLAGAALLLAAGAFGVDRYSRPAAQPSPLSLRVADVGGQLLIDWDPTARPVRMAESGSLEIVDGAARAEIQMDGDRLREGRVDYARRAEVVDVRLMVNARGGVRAAEAVRFAGQPLSVTAPAGEPWKAEVEKLRSELARRDAVIRQLRALQKPPAAPSSPPDQTP
jgi:hypothetical protein